MLNYDEYIKRLGNQLGTVINTYNTSYREFNKINKDVTKITSKESEIELIELDKPKAED